MNLIDIKNYFTALNTANPELKLFYDKIIHFEKTHLIPAVHYETALFLKLITQLTNPKKILEIGFGSGVSSFFIEAGLGSNYEKFISLERDKNRYLRGQNLLNFYNNESITLIQIDAFQYIENCCEKYDFIFLDAVKREYIHYLILLKKILNKNGILICDNLLFGGKVVEHEVADKYQAGVQQLKLFNETLAKDADLFTYYLNLGDGVSVSIKQSLP